MVDITLAEPAQSLSQLVYETVRERIILGRYEQGSRLPEQRIGEELAVSRVSLREAVPCLSAMGSSSLDQLNTALDEAHHVVEERDTYAIARAGTADEAVVQTAAKDRMLKMMRTVSGRMTWLFYLTSGLPAQDAYDDHVMLRDAIASGNERVAESVAYAHIERDRLPTFAAMRPHLR